LLGSLAQPAAVLNVERDWARDRPSADPVVTASDDDTPVGVVVSIATIAAAAWLATLVVRHRFWYDQRRPYHFGAGLSRLTIPLEAAEWLNTHRPAGKLFTNFDASSNLHYFTRPRRDVPLLTNTWAYPPELMARIEDYYTHPHRDVPLLTNTWPYPPELMARIEDYYTGRGDFYQAVRDYSIEIAAITLTAATAPLAQTLDRGDDWTLVHLDVRHAIFLRADGPNAKLALEHAIARPDVDMAARKAIMRAAYPVGAYGLSAGGTALLYLGWIDQAMDVLGEAVQADPRNASSWAALGFAYATRATQRAKAADPGALADFRKALDCFGKVVALRPEDRLAKRNIAGVRQRISAILKRQSGGARP
ncbi:hypothetical protein LCGC14_2360610, partial [marine sediment metagenome]